MTPSGFKISQATIGDLNLLVPLFDAYRVFYRLTSELERATLFLRERLQNGDSVIFLATEGDVALGFTQLFPSFSSGAMARIFVLNDLFVTPWARQRGVGAALLRRAAEYARSVGAVRLTLSTELSNTTAQSVYEKSGWTRDTTFCVYNLALSAREGGS